MKMERAKGNELQFTLNCGRVITVDTFIFEKTADQLFQNYDNVESMADSIARARLRVMRLYGEPQHHLIQPDPSKPLADWCVSVWLNSGPIPGSGASQSGLVVVFFTNYVTGMSKMLGTHLDGLDWNSLAWTVGEVTDNPVKLRLV